MSDLISVIIPVYNAAPYINICIQSVLQQTYSCFELLLVDDGSQDESRDICEKVGQTDNRIRFFPQEHRGVSAARNKALKAAKGNYVFFLDSDDSIHPCLLETLHTVLNRTQASLVVAEYCFTKADVMQPLRRNEITPPTHIILIIISIWLMISCWICLHKVIPIYYTASVESWFHELK